MNNPLKIKLRFRSGSGKYSPSIVAEFGESQSGDLVEPLREAPRRDFADPSHLTDALKEILTRP